MSHFNGTIIARMTQTVHKKHYTRLAIFPFVPDQQIDKTNKALILHLNSTKAKSSRRSYTAKNTEL